MPFGARGLIEWRAVLVAVALVAAGATIRNGIARNAPRASPQSAVEWAGYDARLLSSSAMARIRTLPELADQRAIDTERSAAETEAQRALARDLTSVDALAALGALAEISNDPKRAVAFMNASAALSRRNLPTRLWFIERAVQGNDVEGALKHFDIALRTSAGASDILFPILYGALEEKELLRPILQLLRGNPPWGDRFLYAAVSSGVASENLALVMERLGRRPEYDGHDLTGLLIDVLISQRKFEVARRLNQGSTPGLPRDALVNDPQFRRPLGVPPFTWQLTSGSELDALRGQDPEGRPGLTVNVRSAQSLPVASQLLALPPGRYSFRNSMAPGLPTEASAAWTLSCAHDENILLGRAQLPRNGDEIAVSWTVPAGCSAQWLRLRLDAFELLRDQELFFRPVSLRRD